MKKPEKKPEQNLKPKKKYQKPHIVHTKEIETLAGSCNAGIGNGSCAVQQQFLFQESIRKRDELIVSCVVLQNKMDLLGDF